MTVHAPDLFPRMPFWAWIEEKLLRLGLWINGIDGKDADDIVEHHKTGKLPE